LRLIGTHRFLPRPVLLIFTTEGKRPRGSRGHDRGDNYREKSLPGLIVSAKSNPDFYKLRMVSASVKKYKHFPLPLNPDPDPYIKSSPRY
jgi:hypothetical protein